MMMYKAETDSSSVIVVSTRFSYDTQKVKAEINNKSVRGKTKRTMMPSPCRTIFTV